MSNKLSSLGVSIIYPLLCNAQAKEKDALCEVLKLCAAQKLCPTELILITDEASLKNEIIASGQISKALQTVLPHIEPLELDLKVIKIGALNREKFVNIATKASIGFALCFPPIDVRAINNAWYIHPLSKLLGQTKLLASPLVFHEIMTPHPLLFEYGFVSSARLYNREQLAKSIALGEFTNNDKYLRKALASGSLDMSDEDVYKWAFVFTQKKFCSALAVLGMSTKQREGMYFALQQTPLEQEFFSLGRWDVPYTDLEHLGFFSVVDLPTCTSQCPPNNILIATSIAPTRIQDQQEAINTWILQGFSVVSVNYGDEIAKISEHFPQVHFVEAKRNSMPTLGKKRIYIDEILSVLRAEGHNYKALGIINSDAGLYKVVPSLIIEQCTKGLLISSRMDVPSNNVAAFGYDAYFFGHDVIQTEKKLGEYFLGEPWWDVIFPLYALRNKKQVTQANPPLCFHKEHDLQWDYESFIQRGSLFAKYLYESLVELKPYGLSLKKDFPDMLQEDNFVWFQRLALYWCKHLPARNVVEGVKLEY